MQLRLLQWELFLRVLLLLRLLQLRRLQFGQVAPRAWRRRPPRPTAGSTGLQVAGGGFRKSDTAEGSGYGGAMRAPNHDVEGDQPSYFTRGWGEEPLPPWDTLFGYDRWANERWIAFARRRKWSAGNAVIEHIVRASEVWLARIYREEPSDVSTSTLEMRLAACHVRWIDTLRELGCAKVIRYTNSLGERYESCVGDIAAHVVNHGTYHRGQLRERAGADGLEDFPETDLILFLREFTAPGSL